MPGHHRILIVDDHPTNVAILEESLGDDYVLQTAASGEAALALAPEFHPDLILLDIMMPGLGGYETCRRLRAHPTLRYTKIIMVSAKAMVSERLQGYEAGADDYITKPFEEAELVAKVRVYLRLKCVEEVDRLKSDILALFSHQTHTPLHGILASIQILREAPEMDAKERAMLLDMVYESATTLHRLVEKVRTLSTMRARTWDFQFTTANLWKVVHSAVREVIASAKERHVTIEQTLPEVASTSLDLQQMQRVVTTLLENAVRFSPPGGRVEIRVSQDSDGLTLTVADQGDGIDPEFLPHLFSGFPHTDIMCHSERYGLSLAIAQQIVLAHHGTIGVQSTKGGGTTFTVRLPIGG